MGCVQGTPRPKEKPGISFQWPNQTQTQTQPNNRSKEPKISVSWLKCRSTWISIYSLPINLNHSPIISSVFSFPIRQNGFEKKKPFYSLFFSVTYWCPKTFKRSGHEHHINKLFKPPTAHMRNGEICHIALARAVLLALQKNWIT